MKTHLAKKSKWTIYSLTFITYALYHAVRSAWAGIKNMLNDSPFYFSIDFLGIFEYKKFRISGHGRIIHYGTFINYLWTQNIKIRG